MVEWKEVSGYEGLYLVSSHGDIIALPKLTKCGKKILHRKSKALKTFLRGKQGVFYKSVWLNKDGESKTFSVHRLVAQAFLPNPDGLPEVNHKDENTLNNDVSNLEWCTRQYNIEYSKSKAVYQLDENGIVAKHKSITRASEATGIKRTAINNVLTGWAKTAGGFGWQYCQE